MLGHEISDPHGVEGCPGASAQGLGLLDVRTEFGPGKVLRLPEGSALGAPASGYEIHHGRVKVGDAEEFLGGARSGSVFGTMWHGSLEGDELRAAWLREAAAGREVSTGTVSFASAREGRIELLADMIDEHLDVDALLSMLTDAKALPTLSGILQ